MRPIPTATAVPVPETLPSNAASHDKGQPDDQIDALISALSEAFVSSCELYGDLDLPTGVAFEDLPPEHHARCVRQGRYDAFSQFRSILTWEAAARLAELVAEAAWQFRARELATPPSAFKVSTS